MEPELISTIVNFTTKYAHLPQADVWLTQYYDKSPALLVTAHGGTAVVCRATVNLSQYGEYPLLGHVFIKDYEENEGVREALENAGVIGKAVRTVSLTYVSVTEHELLLAGLDFPPDPE